MGSVRDQFQTLATAEAAAQVFEDSHEAEIQKPLSKNSDYMWDAGSASFSKEMEVKTRAMFHVRGIVAGFMGEPDYIIYVNDGIVVKSTSR